VVGDRVRPEIARRRWGGGLGQARNSSPSVGWGIGGPGQSFRADWRRIGARAGLGWAGLGCPQGWITLPGDVPGCARNYHTHTQVLMADNDAGNLVESEMRFRLHNEMGISPCREIAHTHCK
jgi:hypothetical protein